MPDIACPSFTAPTVDAMPTGRDEEEDMGIRRYDTFQSLAGAVHEASAKAAAMGRLERALLDL